MNRETGPVPSNTNENIRIELQVGERRFTTLRQTLVGESGFFASLLSGRWNSASDDGSYFIDADPYLFDHVLRYLRRGIFPIFYDPVKGHKFPVYHALLEESKYFQISRLEKWLKNQTYLEAVRVEHSVEVRNGSSFRCTRLATSIVEYHPEWRTEKVYVCPQKKTKHLGKQRLCQKKCSKAQDDRAADYEEVPTVEALLVVEKKIIFDNKKCRRWSRKF
ncbi:BTB/POZ protein [Aspergillus flavus]|uniref:BTB/POZ protein n=1 Tax=Aspergillus flavus TaxID=5059 RepID=A0A5N6GJV8_ASPFL|nr:BTB/POZ protein [Aspergillus flavus]